MSFAHKSSKPQVLHPVRLLQIANDQTRFVSDESSLIVYSIIIAESEWNSMICRFKSPKLLGYCRTRLISHWWQREIGD